MISPKVLLTIDYESWTTLRLDYDTVSSESRKSDDGRYVIDTLEEFLDLCSSKISIFLSGEVANWYPEIPKRITSSGHELGFHAHGHRFLSNADDIYLDYKESNRWLNKFKVKGFRAPIVTLPYNAYAALSDLGFTYSSSTYAPAGTIKKINKIWEIPLSTYKLSSQELHWWWPRNLSIKLLLHGEIPYSSSFAVGLLGEKILYWIERTIKSGLSPMIVLHNYQLITPQQWLKKLCKNRPFNILQLVYLRNCRSLIKKIFHNFDVGYVNEWLEEYISEKENG